MSLSPAAAPTTVPVFAAVGAAGAGAWAPATACGVEARARAQTIVSATEERCRRIIVCLFSRVGLLYSKVRGCCDSPPDRAGVAKLADARDSKSRYLDG